MSSDVQKPVMTVGSIRAIFKLLKEYDIQEFQFNGMLIKRETVNRPAPTVLPSPLHMHTDLAPGVSSDGYIPRSPVPPPSFNIPTSPEELDEMINRLSDNE